MNAQDIHDLIIICLWQLNARAERIQGLGRTPHLVRVELQDARRELLLLAERLGEIEPVRRPEVRP